MPSIGHHHDLEAGHVGPPDGTGGTVNEAEILVGITLIDIDDPVTVKNGLFVSISKTCRKPSRCNPWGEIFVAAGISAKYRINSK